MSLRTLALDWSADGSVGLAFGVLLVAAGLGYLLAGRVGARRDRRGRSWPRRRTFCFLAGLVVLAVDLYSGIGTEADTRLSIHMIEHMVMWVLVAPLLAAGAPVRLAFFALPRTGRRPLARALRGHLVSSLTGPVGSVSLFSTVILISHLPAVYGLTLRSEYVHAAEHGLYLLTALLVWAPLLGFDPLPHRPGPRGQIACMVACMVPMVLVAVWLASAAHPVYGRYVRAPGPSALHDQRLAATIMWTGCLSAFAVPILARLRIPRRANVRRLRSHRVPA
jgi:putative membrane protein